SASLRWRRSCRHRCRNQTALLEQLQNPLCALLGLLVFGLDPDLGNRGRLVRVGHSGELLDLAAERLLVQALDVPARTLFDRRVDEDLYERPVLLDHVASVLPRLAVGRDRRDDHGRAVARQARGDPADAVDVRVAILLREAETLGKVLADLVAVEPLDEAAPPFELRPDELGDRRLPG